MIEEQNRDIRIIALNFCPDDCKYREVDSENLYTQGGNEIIAKSEYCKNMYVCKNAAEAYEDFRKKEEARKIEEARNKLVNVTNEFKFR